MTAFWVQVVVFCFSGLNNLVGFYLAVSGDIETAIVVTVFSTAIIFLIVAAFNPYDILEIAFSGKGGLKIKRNQPSPEERKEILKIAQDEPVKVDEKEKEKLVEAAKNRPDERRSAEDYIVLATEFWRAKKYDDALKLAFVGSNLNPENKRIKATLINRIGSIYGDLKVISLEETYYKKAMELDAQFSTPCNNLGVNYFGQKKFAEAEIEYKKAIELDPENADTVKNLETLQKLIKKQG